jgi:hypothetical protein
VTITEEEQVRRPAANEHLLQAILDVHPEWAYLADPALPAREPTEEETARYADRRNNPEWDWFYGLTSPARRPCRPVGDTTASGYGLEAARAFLASRIPVSEPLAPPPPFGTELPKRQEDAFDAFTRAHDETTRTGETG